MMRVFDKNNDVIKISYCALCIALSFAFTKLTIFSLPFGGEVTILSMFIISLPGYAYGLKYGFISSTALGLIKTLIAGHANHPASLLLDYFIPYFVFGLTGLSYKKSFKEFECYYVLCAFLRFISSTISGYFLWASYCPKGMNLIVYTILYNISYVGCEVILTLIIVNLPTIKSLTKKIIQAMQI